MVRKWGYEEGGLRGRGGQDPPPCIARFGASLSLLLGVTLSAALAAGEKISLYEVGTQRQLLIDKAFFDQSYNLRLRLHPTRKTGEIVLKREHPWESATLNWFSPVPDAD